MDEDFFMLTPDLEQTTAQIWSDPSSQSKMPRMKTRWANFPNQQISFSVWTCVCPDTYDQSGLQEVQLEDGSTAYIQHTVHMPQSNTILAIQADGTIADLQTDATGLDPETISVLEQYTTKVSGLAWACQ